MPIKMKTKTESFVVHYPEAINFTDEQIKILWTHGEIKVEKDIHDILTNFDESEKHAVITALKLFTLYELKAGVDYWCGRYMKTYKRPELQRMAAAFGFFEMCVHKPFYNKINEALHLNNDEFYTAYVNDPTLKGRMDFIDNAIKDKDDLFSVAVFSMVEGAILYSSFAFLKHFQSKGKNKALNIVRGVNFSVRDECVVDGTEALTQRGWVDIGNLLPTDKVAQFDPVTSAISFVVPDRIVEHDVSEDIVRYQTMKGGMSQAVTMNHRMLFKNDDGKHDKYDFRLAKDHKYHAKNFAPVSGYVISGKDSLSNEERFKIMTQADGSVSDRYTGEICGTRPVYFTFSKQRKIDRFLKLVEVLGYNYTRSDATKENGNVKEKHKFTVDVPVSMDFDSIKSFKWVDISNISTQWCNEFIEELSHWDGHIPKDTTINGGNYVYYSSTIKENAEVVQGIASLCGKHATLTKQIDDRSVNFSDVHRVYIHSRDHIRGGSVKKTTEHYDGKVRCVTVPTGAFVIRYNDVVGITGNCMHSEGGSWTYRTHKREEGRSVEEMQALELRIQEAALQIYEHEERIIDMMYEKGEIKNCSKADLKIFVKSRLNICLGNLEIKPVFDFDPETNTIETWFYDSINKFVFNDFFSGIGREYVRDWNEDGFVWKSEEELAQLATQIN